MVLVHSSPPPWTTTPHGHSAQCRSTTPPLACKTPGTTRPAVRPQSVRSTSYSSVPRLKDIDVSLSVRPSSSAAINIPSPPLTPHHSFDDDHTFQEDRSSTAADSEDDSDSSGIFSSRFQRQHRLQRDEQELKLRPSSSSAPSAMSPLQMRASSNVPMTTTGFTFTSNTHAKEARESYEYFLSTMEDDYWKSVSTIRTTYFFDGIGRGGGFLAVSRVHLYACVQCAHVSFAPITTTDHSSVFRTHTNHQYVHNRSLTWHRMATPRQTSSADCSRPG